MKQKHRVIGKFGKVFGVAGWIKVISYTNPTSNITKYTQHWLLERKDKGHVSWHPIKVEAHRNHHKTLVVKIEGYDDCDQARALTNALISIPDEELPELKQDEYYWHQLIGLEVVTITGESLGTIKEIQETASNDVLSVKGERLRLIPYLMDDVIKSIDLENSKMVVDWDPAF